MTIEKLYIPVMFFKQKCIKTTLIAVKSCPTVRAQLPQWEDVLEHMRAQQVRIQQGQPFSTIKILVPVWVFKRILQEVAHKAGRIYRTSVIDLIIQSGQPPLIQILIDKNARRKRLN